MLGENNGSGHLPGWVSSGIAAIIAGLSSAVVALFRWTQKRLCEEIDALKAELAATNERLENVREELKKKDAECDALTIENVQLKLRVERDEDISRSDPQD